MKREYLIQKPVYIIYLLTFLLMLVFSLSFILFDYDVPGSNRMPTTIVSTATMIIAGFLIFTMFLPGLMISNDNKMFYINIEEGRTMALIYKWIGAGIALIVGVILYILLAEVQMFAFRDLISGDEMQADFIFSRIPYAIVIPVILYCGKLLFTHSVLRHYVNKTYIVLLTIIIVLFSLAALWVYIVSFAANEELGSNVYNRFKLITYLIIILSFGVDFYLMKYGDVHD